MIRLFFLVFFSLMPFIAQAGMYYCIDAEGQRIFSDRPCSETTVGQGIVSNYDGGSISLKHVPIVVGDEAANKIRYQLTPAQVKEKYCAKYTEAERGRLIQTKQVVLGMYLADVIKVWGAPIANDGNKVLFQEGDDSVVISLLEGCVVNIERDYVDDDGFLNPSISDNAIDNDINY